MILSWQHYLCFGDLEAPYRGNRVGIYTNHKSLNTSLFVEVYSIHKSLKYSITKKDINMRQRMSIELMVDCNIDWQYHSRKVIVVTMH